MNPEVVKKIAIATAASVSLIIVTVVLVSKVKDKAHKEFVEKHDIETAERLSKSFNERVDKLQKDSISKFKQGVKDLCKEYQIEYVLA